MYTYIDPEMLQQILKYIDQHDPNGFQDTVMVIKEPLYSAEWMSTSCHENPTLCFQV